MYTNTTETQGAQGNVNSHVLGIFLISYHSNVAETHKLTHAPIVNCNSSLQTVTLECSL